MNEIAFSRLIALLRVILLGVIAAGVLIAACALAFSTSAKEDLPLYLNREEAAHYLGLSNRDFDRLVTADGVRLKKERNDNSISSYPILFTVIEIEGNTYYQRESLENLKIRGEFSSIYVKDGEMTLE